MKREETFALIVGGGPVGLSMAIELGWRGVPFILVSQNFETSKHPKCNSTNARSMEHFRRLGIAAEIRANALPPQCPREVAFTTRFCGYELSRLDLVHLSTANSPWPTPEPPIVIPQTRLEPMLKKFAESHACGSVRFGHRLVAFELEETQVTARIEDLASGSTYEIVAQYLLGVDGAPSPVRRQLGIRLQGEDGSAERAFMSGNMLSYFVRVPELTARSGRRPALLTWIINQEVRGFMFTQDAKELWIVHYQVPKNVDPRALNGRDIVSRMLGADVDFEILSGGPWKGGLALVADQFRQGRALLLGDAAHLFTPLGGLGMNCGIGDVANLGWKLAALAQGWGGPALLDSYAAERRPIALRNTQLGIAVAKVMSAWVLPADLEAPGAEADKARKTFGNMCAAEDAFEYLTEGMQLGERYEDSPVVYHDASQPPADTWETYTPIDRAGARTPHFWLSADRTRSLYDEMGPGLTLLVFGEQVDTSAFDAAARKRGAPLKTVQARSPESHLYPSQLVLVRSDHHIAWHGDRLPENPQTVLDRVLGFEHA